LPTPLLNLKHFAREIGIRDCYIKDESQSLGLNAFKALGASYAMAEEIKKYIPEGQSNLSFKSIKSHKKSIKDLTFVTATDGNHGRAVAWCAEQYGCRAVVFMPKCSSEIRLKAILEHKAKAEITDLNYDETVKYAESEAIRNDWVLLQDSSWPGYTEVPKNIMAGYTTMALEFFEQTPDWPTHIIAQAGVGSFAASIFSSFICSDKQKPKLILLEPSGAACFFNSVKIGDKKPHLTPDLNTMMAGLSCGMPSILAWDIIVSIADFFTICEDNIAIKGMQILSQPLQGDPLIISGESGAVPIGFLHEVATNPLYSDLRDQLQLDVSSKVLFFSTEGDTDPDLYKKYTS
jgi:diaminopropionate ammonia-lyase